MIGVRENKITRVPLMEAVAMVRCSAYNSPREYYSPLHDIQTQEVTNAIKAKDFDKAMALRDPEFQESLEGFFITSMLPDKPVLPPAQRIRVAIMQYVHQYFILSLHSSHHISSTAWVPPQVV